MEANLFWIGVGLGVYAYLLRWLDRTTRWLKSPAVANILHVLFYAAGGSLVGFIFSASTEIQGPTAEMADRRHYRRRRFGRSSRSPIRAREKEAPIN